MDRTFTIALAFLIILAAAPVAQAADPCKEKRQQRHTAHKQLHNCIRDWLKDVHPEKPDPADDCGAKLSAFVQTARDLKACRAEARKK